MNLGRVVFCGLLLLGGQLFADVINYQGRLSIDGKPFDGTSQFKFFLVGAQGEVAWSSQEISLNVSNGAYAVRLGDSAQAPPISTALLRSGTPAKLRIWFNQKEKGWARLGDDVAVASENIAAPGAMGGEGAAILAELRAIRALLAGQHGGQRPPEAPQIVTVSTAGAPSLGKADAPLVLVEFTDFQCSFCIKFDREVFTQLKTKYVDTGKLRIVSRQLPLPFHQFAAPAAKAAFCAQAQGRYWELRELLFAANGSLAPDAIKKAAHQAILDLPRLDVCAAGPEAAGSIQKDVQDAKAVGIEGTPSFVLGKATGDKVTGLKIVGALPLANFEAEISKQLAGDKKP